MGNPVFQKGPFNPKASPQQQTFDYGNRSTATGYAPQAGQQFNLEQTYQQPVATPGQMGRLTYDDVIVKTLGMFLVLLVGAGIGWFVPALAIVGAIAGLVLGLVNSFKKDPSPVLITLYSAAQGLFVGGISMWFEQVYPGIVFQAVLGSLCVFGVTLALFASGKVRATPKMTKIFLVAMVGYLVFSLVNVLLMVFNAPGVGQNAFGMRSIEVLGIPLGVIIGLLAVLMAAYSLVMDFDSIKQGVEYGAPAKFAWTAAFGLIVTLVWLYTEILRILAILRGND